MCKLYKSVYKVKTPEVWQIQNDEKTRYPYTGEIFIAANDIRTVFEKYPYAISIEHIGYFGGEL